VVQLDSKQVKNSVK